MNTRAVFPVTAGGFPSGGSALQTLEFAIKYAALAPTENGLKTWCFRLTNTCIELMTKDIPAQESVDPERREVLIGCGSALLYLKLALKQVGCLGKVTLFPDIGEPELVARIHFGLCGAPSAQEKLFFEAMIGSPAMVTSSDENPISETTLAELDRAAAGERGWLDFVRSEMSCKQVEEATQTDGPGSPNAMPRVGLSFVYGMHNNAWRVGTISPVQQPLAVVKTKTDDKHGWLEAGQTLARTVLQARALGLMWAFSDLMRRRETRAALRLGIGHKGFAQVMLRFGSQSMLQWNPAVGPSRHPVQPPRHWR